MSSQPAGDEWLTPGGVAALLFLDRNTVTRWAKTGKLAFTRTPGGHRRFRKSEMLAISRGGYQRLDDPVTLAAVPAQRSGERSHERTGADARAAAQITAAVVVAARETAGAAEVAAEVRALAAREAAEVAAGAATGAAAAMKVRTELEAAHASSTARRAVLQAMASTDPDEHA